LNPFIDPIFLSRAIKSYLADPGRLKKMKDYELKKYQNLSFKRIVKYSFNIPLYHDKYKKANVYPIDIKGLDDIKKLPFITKDDFRKYSPDKTIPKTFFKENWIVSRTGGTTDKPLPVYFDLLTVVKVMLGLLRALNEHDINWKKTKMSLLIDLSERSFENEYFINSIFNIIKPMFKQKNIQIFDLFNTSAEVIKKIDEFQPDFIAGYPYAFNQLLLLRGKGFGENIHPRYIMSSGACLDKYLRKLVEETFDTKIFDFYAATESGPIAFECKEGKYHVHSDLVYTEFIKDKENVSIGEPGAIVITKLYGNGTTLIRYTGIDDIVTTIDGNCSCGLGGMLLKKIHGRKNNSILLPNGKMILPSFIENILGETTYDIKSNKIKRLQIVQHKLNNLEIKILFDKELKKIGKSNEETMLNLKQKLIKKIGKNVEFNVHEVDKFEIKDPYYICKIDRSSFIEKEYLI
jgi:phenylacetate-CoA ligase